MNFRPITLAAGTAVAPTSVCAARIIRSWSCSRFLVCVAGALCLLPQAGCSKEDAIRHYTIVRQTEGAGTPKGVAATAPDQDHRMLAAIAPHGSQNWFFKVMAPADVLGKEQLTDFLTLIKSIEFGDGDDASPKWDLPEGWRERPGSGMRFATLEFTAGGATQELTVTRLGARGGDNEDEDILANVNRWRGQLQLEPISLEDMPKTTLRMPRKDGGSAVLINLVGRPGSRPMQGGAPFAPFASGDRPRPAAAPPGGGADERTPPLTYDTPQEWLPGKVGGMRKAAFEVHDREQKIEITAIDLPAAGGAMLPNVNRWRDQVGLAPITQAELDRDLKPISIGKLTGQRIELVGVEKEGRRQTIHGAIVTADDKAWFFKLQGDAALAERERERFIAFVESIRIQGAEGADNGK